MLCVCMQTNSRSRICMCYVLTLCVFSNRLFDCCNRSMNGFLFCFLAHSKNLSTSTHTRRINDLDTYTKYIYIYIHIHLHIY